MAVYIIKDGQVKRLESELAGKASDVLSEVKKQVLDTRVGEAIASAAERAKQAGQDIGKAVADAAEKIQASQAAK